MSSSEHIESVSRASRWGAGKPGTLFELWRRCRLHETGGTPLSGVYRGRDAVAQPPFGPLGAALATPLRFSMQPLLADGDHVVMQAEGRSELHSGVAYNNTYCMVFRFAGRQVIEVTEYLDTQLVTRAFAVPAERERLLRAMDLNCWEMFRDIVRLGRGAELLETPQYYMGYGPRGTLFHNMVMLRDRVDLDALFDRIRRFYVERGAPFSIWTRAHADGEIEAALRARGFNVFTTMPGMALLSDPGTRCEPPGLKIRAAIDDAGRRAYLEVTAAAYATYGAPVAAAAVYITHGVAGIGWVGTQPAQRGHGYAEAVTWAAIREGFRRGAAFANLQASPMGRPIYERMGFITPTEYRVLFGTV